MSSDQAQSRSISYLRALFNAVQRDIAPKTLKTAASAILLVALAAQPLSATIFDECRHGHRPDARVRACGEIIGGWNFGAEEKALAYNSRGEARVEAGAFGQAIADFTASIQLTRDNVPAFAGRGYARFASGDLTGAIADYSEAIRFAPDSAELYFERGHIHLASGNVGASIRDLTTAIRLNPENAAAYNNRGLAFRKQGDAAHALQDYGAAIALNPVYALAYANRGYLYEGQGRKNEAIGDLQHALALDPSQPEVMAALKRLGVASGATAESAWRIREGKALVQANCSACHAVDAQGASPNIRAPEFRNLQRRHRLLALREPISRAIAAPHDEMPQFFLSEMDVDLVVAYINSLAVKK
jgi:tetratricopeptide (TPR) repeat protein